MAGITEYLNQILSAIYGKDVRQSIHDSIKEIWGIATGAQSSATSAMRTAISKAAEAIASAKAAKQSETNAAASEANAKTYAANASAVAGVGIATQETAGLIRGGENYVDESGALVLTKTTTDTTLHNSHAGGIKLLGLHGKSAQESTTGAQLFDADNPTLNAIIDNGIVAYYESYNLYAIPVTVGESYTLSKSACTNAAYLGFYSELPSIGVTLTDRASITATEELNITATDNYLCLIFSKSDDVSAVMLNAGTTALPWEKFTGGAPSPSMEYPQEIKKTVVSEIVAHGANLFNPVTNDVTLTSYEVSENGYKIVTEAPAGVSSRALFNLDCLIGKTAVIQCDKVVVLYGNSANVVARFRYVVDGDVKYKYFYPNSGKVTATFPENTTAIRLQLFGNCSILSTFETRKLEFYGLRITYAENADLPWMPYAETVAALSQPIELNGIGEVADRLAECNKIIQNIGKLNTSDIKSVFASSVANPNGNVYIITFASSSTNILWTTRQRTSGDSIATIGANEYLSRPQSGVSGQINVYFVSDATTTEDALAEIKAEASDIYYALNEPVETELPTADQIALNSLKSFDGTTYLYCDSEVQPTMEIEYGTSRVGALTLDTHCRENVREIRLNELEALTNSLATALVAGSEV